MSEIFLAKIPEVCSKSEHSELMNKLFYTDLVHKILGIDLYRCY